MSDYTISKLTELASAIEALSGDGTRWLYRGVTNEDYLLIPKIGRPETWGSKRYTLTEENNLGRKFYNASFAHLRDLPPRHDIDVLVIAQHHGLPTRLLDWTYSALVAAYFACQRPHESGRPMKDAVIYAMRIPERMWTAGADQKQMQSGDVIDPPHISPRIVAQRSAFTYHSCPTEPFVPSSLRRMIVRRAACDYLCAALNNCGVNSATLFPDLDGLASYYHGNCHSLIR